MSEIPFWSFSVEFYGRPGVSPACIALQDRFGCDVNLVLFSIWAARCGVALGASEFARLDESVGPWRERVVVPIRALRRGLKTDALEAAPELAESCRQTLLKAELEAERAAQEMIARALPLAGGEEGSIDARTARENLSAYLASRGADSSLARQLAATILAAL